jgi:hypothetical protein
MYVNREEWHVLAARSRKYTKKDGVSANGFADEYPSNLLRRVSKGNNTGGYGDAPVGQSGGYHLPIAKVTDIDPAEDAQAIVDTRLGRGYGYTPGYPKNRALGNFKKDLAG